MSELHNPKPSKKKGRSKRVKRKEVDAGDGWTVVTHTSANPSRQTTKKATKPAASFPATTVDGLTSSKLIAEYEHHAKRFRNSECARRLTAILRKKTWGVKEAVCVGIGSFSLDWENRYRAVWQLVLFMYVAEIVSADADTKLYACEPIFTSLDVSLLTHLRVVVISANIQNYITPFTYVFSPFVDWYILLPDILRDKDPELYLGNQIVDDYSTAGNTDEKKVASTKICNEIGKRWVGAHDEIEVPEFEGHTNALKGLVVYWRKDIYGT